MSLKAIREADGKKILTANLSNYLKDEDKSKSTFVVAAQTVTITEETNLDTLHTSVPWLLTTKLVAKPDQLIKRRGKGNLLLLNADWETTKKWIIERRGKNVTIETVQGQLNTFLVEPFVPHKQSDEYYFSIISGREGETILFHHEGGVDVGDVDAKAMHLLVEVMQYPTREQIAKLVEKVPASRQQPLIVFIEAAFKMYIDLNFGLMEINPLVMITEGSTEKIVPLDMAAKLDKTAEFESGDKWCKPEFPPAFGRPALPEEKFIAELDSKTGASLKLTILNPAGRVWTMVAGGGASVIYADTIADLGYSHELANYGEYSGAPTEGHTYEYAKTILDLMTRGEVNPKGKFLIIGGGIANFTNVASTFKGIVKAITEYRDQLKLHSVAIYVRRGGPNYQEGLKLMRELGSKLGLNIHVFGPETHLTAIVSMALKDELASEQTKKKIKLSNDEGSEAAVNNDSQEIDPNQVVIREEHTVDPQLFGSVGNSNSAQTNWYTLFNKDTRSVVYGMQPRAVQEMLDFDYMCRRSTPSVACMVYPMSGNHFQKFYFGTKEILVPVYQSLDTACKKYPEVSVVVNFSSFRGVWESMQDIFNYSQIKVVAIIAEGVPEYRTRCIIKRAHKQGVTIIGPATVGGIKAGCFRIGNTGGMLDNIIDSKLYRAGSVAYVSRSGGMSNELNNIISRKTNGVYEGIAIGGDRYPGTSFLDHLLRYEAEPEIKMMVLLGEVGGIEEYEIIKAIKEKRIKKPLIAWCIGTCASMFSYEVQFGHAGAQARGDMETAKAKNEAFRAVGARVPSSFNDLADVIKQVYDSLVRSRVIIVAPEVEPPKVPLDFNWAKELGLIRKPASFISTICDDRGEELLYSGMPITSVFKEDLGIGGVVSLLWFQRRLPAYACKFIEMILMVTADHGPAVSGAHNTIVTARAGKDMISSLVSGLLTIGPRFGGAIDDAARQFSKAKDDGLTPNQFVSTTRKNNTLISGIGHRIKSLENPDMRVSIIKDFAKANFPSTDLLNYALEVEKITTQKRSTLILNVDGCIGCCFVDLLRGCGGFSQEEADQYIQLGALNGLFVLGRSIGFIGHYLDQVRLKQGLYRHPAYDINYTNPGDFDM